MHAQQRLFAGRAKFVQIPAHAERDFLGVQDFSGVGGRAMLGAAAALDAREGLQRDQLRDVLAGIQAEVFVARERRNLAESIALQEDRHRAQQQVQMFGVRDQRQEHENGERVRPPQQTARFPAGTKVAR